MRLILYSKPGCHLCEGLQEKLEQIQNLSFELEVRDITSREEWFRQYEYEIPVLYIEGSGIEGGGVSGVGCGEAGGQSLRAVPRISPRASVAQVEQVLRKCLQNEG